MQRPPGKMSPVKRALLPAVAALAVGVVIGTIGYATASDGATAPPPRKTAKAQKPGPLRPLQANPRYFTDGRSGKPIYLVGSHTWWNQGDETWPVCGGYGKHGRFDFDAYLDRLQAWGHNFVRLWRVELTRWVECDLVKTTRLHPWPRTGPGAAADGLPKFDLTRFDQAFFDRLRERVVAARNRRIYVGVMLFEGFATQLLQEAWAGHPFNSANNVNGVEADTDRNGHGIEVHRLASGHVVRLQEAYVRKVIDTLNDLDNVIWEIANEPGRGSTRWQYHMIRFVKRYEASKPKQHPVGMTLAAPDGLNDELFRSPADWISPGGATYEHSPAPADGRKISILDTDHVCQICGHSQVVWKNFTRGHNVILMDPLDDDPGRVQARRSMAQTLRYSRRIGLARMRPSTVDCSTGFCLVNSGREYLVYQPSGGTFRVNLHTTRRAFTLEWFDPIGERIVPGGRVSASYRVDLTPPFPGEAVAYLRATHRAGSRRP
jgi:Family of unknown function (DUF6298)